MDAGTKQGLALLGLRLRRPATEQKNPKFQKIGRKIGKKKENWGKLENVNFGTFYVLDSHPTPSSVFACSGAFSGFFFLVGLVALRRNGDRSFVCCMQQQYNASVNRDGGEARDTPTPHLGLSS